LVYNPETHEYSVDGKRPPSVTEILEAVGVSDHRFVPPEALKRGSDIHLACHYYVTGVLDMDTLHPDYVPYLTRFAEFIETTGFQVEASEVPAYHEDYKFCGCPDLVGRMNGHTWLIDIKSNSSPKWSPIQLAAYQQLLEGTGCMGWPIQKRGVLLLKPDRPAKLIPCREVSDHNEWQVCLSMYRTLEKYGRLNGGRENGS